MFFRDFRHNFNTFLKSLWPNLWPKLRHKFINLRRLLNMKKRTNHDTRLALIDIIISYSTILYHIIVDSQYVTNVGKIMPKMLYEIFVNTCKH